MGTRSDIIVHLSNGKWARIYCHWDGYLSHNGKILFDHYTDQKHVEALIALGNGKATVRPAVQAFGMVIGKHAAHDPTDPDKHSWTS